MKLLLPLVFAIVAVPAVSALPAVCGPDCRINASSFPGYDPAVAVIASGSSVTWHSVDTTHATRDATVTGAGQCFFVTGEGGEDSPPVRFEIVDGALQATAEGSTERCANAVGNGAGGFVMQYFCVLHPLMRAALVVTN